MRVHVLQHVAFEGPAAIADWAAARGHELRATRLFDGAELPRLGAFDALVAMGGPMSANDDGKFAWMAPEKRLIAEALASGAPVLGVCLGAQLIASVAGARVFANAVPEIGWFPVRLTREAATHALFRGLPAEFVPLHWHGETFELPRGSVRLAESPACANQAFAIGARVLGLQFHLEATAESVAQLVAHCGHELVAAPTVQGEVELLAGAASAPEIHALLYRILDRWAAGRLERGGVETKAV
jgi:GMP synthase-like glutamine amidotransferase